MINEDKIRCPNCKKLIVWNSIFCNYCGIRIKRRVKLEDDGDNVECLYCHELNEPGSRFCVSCGMKIDLTPSMSENITDEFQNIEDPVAFINEIDEGLFIHCPICNSSFQEQEFLDYLKNKACCPICRTNLDFLEFKSYLLIGDREDGSGAKYFNVYEEKFSKICQYCQNLIPNQARFCIFCGLPV